MKYERVLMLILVVLGLGTGVMLIAAPHEYAHDVYRAEELRTKAQPTTIHDGSATALRRTSPVRVAPTVVAPVATPIAAPLLVPTPAPVRNTYSFSSTIAGTVIDAMRAESAAGRVSFSTKEYPGLGELVDSIDGQKNNNGTYWFLYLHGRSSDLGASVAHVEPGDIVEWRYEKNQ